jgi:hypothetical protein
VTAKLQQMRLRQRSLMDAVASLLGAEERARAVHVE